MVSPAHSTKVCRKKVGQAQRQWTQCLLPLRSVTGATPAYFWKAAALSKQSRWLAEGGHETGGEDTDLHLANRQRASSRGGC